MKMKIFKASVVVVMISASCYVSAARFDDTDIVHVVKNTAKTPEKLVKPKTPVPKPTLILPAVQASKVGDSQVESTHKPSAGATGQSRRRGTVVVEDIR
ncbi:hypothetical protein [Oceanicoccus sp. KOV_DT_Chl]|uniref:hypothetical protein n=1 Tax=Oceanicoccus sp. KOV_DT_Chl TaxID=1904639 RepID=UPI0011AF66FE|nr:hypothetical protein [Oceanicoccus sp. KOV_DT_Chl]